MVFSGGGESLLAAAFGGGLLLAAGDDGRVKRHECRTGDRRTDGMSSSARSRGTTFETDFFLSSVPCSHRTLCQRLLRIAFDHLISSNSTVKMSVAIGGMAGAEPRSP